MSDGMNKLAVVLGGLAVTAGIGVVMAIAGLHGINRHQTTAQDALRSLNAPPTDIDPRAGDWMIGSYVSKAVSAAVQCFPHRAVRIIGFSSKGGGFYDVDLEVVDRQGGRDARNQTGTAHLAVALQPIPPCEQLPPSQHEACAAKRFANPLGVVIVKADMPDFGPPAGDCLGK